MRIRAADKNVVDTNDASGTALTVLAKQLLILEKVDQAANEYIKNLRLVDPIEVKLAFCLGLREKLNLFMVKYCDIQHINFISCLLKIFLD